MASTIPTSGSQRLRRIRCRFLPPLVFLACVAACGWLWQRQERPHHAVGAVEAARVEMVSPKAGTLALLTNSAGQPWSRFDRVAAGQPLAKVDDVELRAPISGTIVDVQGWSGQSVPAGFPILAIAEDRGRYILSYIPQDAMNLPAEGSRVTVRPRMAGAQRFVSEVERVGPRIEVVPLQQLQDVNIPEWGLPVRIALPSEFDVQPGILVDVVFHRGES